MASEVLSDMKFHGWSHSYRASRRAALHVARVLRGSSGASGGGRGAAAPAIPLSYAPIRKVAVYAYIMISIDGCHCLKNFFRWFAG